MLWYFKAIFLTDSSLRYHKKIFKLHNRKCINTDVHSVMAADLLAAADVGGPVFSLYICSLYVAV